jgi:hypothetical protein
MSDQDLKNLASNQRKLTDTHTNPNTNPDIRNILNSQFVKVVALGNLALSPNLGTPSLSNKQLEFLPQRLIGLLGENSFLA